MLDSASTGPGSIFICQGVFMFLNKTQPIMQRLSVPRDSLFKARGSIKSVSYNIPVKFSAYVFIPLV